MRAALDALSSRTAAGWSGNRLNRDAAKWAAVVALEAAAPLIAAAAKEEQAAAAMAEFARGYEEGAAVERDRIADLLSERAGQLMQGAVCGADAEALWEAAAELRGPLSTANGRGIP